MTPAVLKRFSLAQIFSGVARPFSFLPLITSDFVTSVSRKNPQI